MSSRKMATAAGRGRPSAEEITKALSELRWRFTLKEMKNFAFRLGVPRKDVDAAAASATEAPGGDVRFEPFVRDFVKKWLDSDPNAGWEKLTSVLVDIAMARPPGRIITRPIISPRTGHIQMQVVICGPCSAGKSFLFYRFLGFNPTPNDSLSISATFRIKTVSVEGEMVEMHMWDTLGMVQMRSLLAMYLTRAWAVVLVYNITDMESFRDMDNFVKEIQKSSKEDNIFVLVGSWLDQEDKRSVPREVGEKLAEEKGFQFFEASGKTGQNVDDVFQYVAWQMVRKKMEMERSGRISLTSGRRSQDSRRSYCV